MASLRGYNITSLLFCLNEFKGILRDVRYDFFYYNLLSSKRKERTSWLRKHFLHI